MTLILVLGNRDQFIQLSDRRLSAHGLPFDEESNKAGLFICSDARLIYGFTGIAKIGNFSTNDWLLSSLYDSGPPDYIARNTIERLKLKATHDFKTISDLNCVPKCIKRLSIMFSGYQYFHNPPRGSYAILSNYQDFENRIEASEVWDDFRCTYWREKRPYVGEFSLVQRIGTGSAMNDNDVSELRKLLLELKPAKAIIEKGVQLIKDMSNRDNAFGAIGKQISSICIPRDINMNATSGYHTNSVSYDYYMPDFIVSINDKKRSVFSNIHARPQDITNHPPIIVPKVKRKSPCPCKSGKKYKHCHGR